MASGTDQEKAYISEWRKDLAPSDRLRKWFNHEPKKWDEFRRRYHEELRKRAKELQELARKKRPATITFLYGARDQEHNNAVALKELLDELRTGAEPGPKLAEGKAALALKWKFGAKNLPESTRKPGA